MPHASPQGGDLRKTKLVHEYAPLAGVLDSFQTGFGRTLASTGSIIVLGVVFGKLLAE